MVKEIHRVAVTLRSVEEFYVSRFSGNKEKDPIQKARFLKIECDVVPLKTPADVLEFGQDKYRANSSWVGSLFRKTTGTGKWNIKLLL